MGRPVFNGSFDDFEALAAYERELKAWEQSQQLEMLAKAERIMSERRVELHKTFGPAVLTGGGVPDDDFLGIDGQGYIDWATGDYYIKEGTWQLVANFVDGGGGGGGGARGPEGPPGMSGPPGPAGPPGTGGGGNFDCVLIDNLGDTIASNGGNLVLQGD